MSQQAGRQPQGEAVEMQPIQGQGRLPEAGQGGGDSFSAKSRGGFSKFIQTQGKKTAAYVKGYDAYGQPINLSYQGARTFKTVPGGAISLVIKIVFILYAILKFKYMMVRQEWKITRQEKVASGLDLNVEHRLGDDDKFKNLSLGVQFNRKPAKLKRPEEIELNATYLFDTRLKRQLGYEITEPEDEITSKLEDLYQKSDTRSDMILLSKYLRFFGMIEEREGADRNPFNTTINKDAYSWKEYTPTWAFSEAGMYQMNVDMSDAVIKGTENDDPGITEVISKYQLRFDINRMRYESFITCQRDEVCGSKLKFTTQEMEASLKEFIQDMYGSINAEQEEIDKYIGFVEDLSISPDYNDSAAFRDYFYIEYQDSVVTNARVERALSNSDFFDKEINKRRSDWHNPIAALFEVDDAYVEYMNGLDLAFEDDEQKQIWEETEKKITNANEIKKQYLDQDKKFRDEIDYKIAKYNIELVLDDEIEAFKKHDDDEFDYPFQARKNKVASFTMDMDPYTETYEYPQEFITFQQSFVCLEPSIFRQMFFVVDLLEEGIKAIAGKSESKDIDDQLEDFCENTLFQKLKLKDSRGTWKDYKDDYEPEVIEEKILLEIILGQDAFKTQTVRYSSQILDFLRDIGGFNKALDLMVFVFGTYFSSKLFAASIAKTLYIQSRKKKDIARDEAAEEEAGGSSNFFLGKIFTEDKEEGFETNRPMLDEKEENEVGGKKKQPDNLQTRMKKLANQFSPIEFSSHRVVMDPFFSYFFCCFKEEKIKKSPVFKRQKVLAKCQKKLNDELEITNLLTRVRESYEMLQNLQTEQQKELLKYSKDKVINLIDSDSSSSEEDQPPPTDGQVPGLNKPSVPPQDASSVSSSDAIQLDLPEELRRAFDFSIVKGLALDANERMDLIQKLATFEEEKNAVEAIEVDSNIVDETIPPGEHSFQARYYGPPKVGGAEVPPSNVAKGAGVCDGTLAQIDSDGENEKIAEDGENKEAAQEDPADIGDIKTALVNQEPPDKPDDAPVDAAEVILSGVAGKEVPGESKVNEAKPDEPQPEGAKPDEAKPEEGKQEEAKPEDPKPEEDAKPDQPKAEVGKPEEPKADKPAEAKAEDKDPPPA